MCHASLLDAPEGTRRSRRLREVIDLLWQTDEIRAQAPDPVDEARNGVYYLEGLSSGALLDVLEELGDRLSDYGVELPLEARPLLFGSWIGGDRDGNPQVTPSVTVAVLQLHAAHGISLIRRSIEHLRRDLSVSNRISGTDPAFYVRLRDMLAHLPEVEPRYLLLNAEEP